MRFDQWGERTQDSMSCVLGLMSLQLHQAVASMQEITGMRF